MTRRTVQPLALALLALAGWLGAVAFSGCARGGTDADAVDILVATASGYQRYLRSDAPDVLRYTSRLTGPVRAEAGSAPAGLRMVYYTDGRVSATVDLHLDTARGTGWARRSAGGHQQILDIRPEAVAFARQVAAETRQGTRGPRRHP
jgi:hypothetical protein